MSYNQNIIHIHIIYIYISYPTSPPRRLSYPCSSFPTSSPPIGRPPPWSATCYVETIRRGKKEKTTGAGFHGKLLRVNIIYIYIYEYVYIYNNIYIYEMISGNMRWFLMSLGWQNMVEPSPSWVNDLSWGKAMVFHHGILTSKGCFCSHAYNILVTNIHVENRGCHM